MVPDPEWENEQQDGAPGVPEAMNDHDLALQYKLVLLLSTLEQQCLHLNGALTQGDLLAALDLARAMVDGLVAVAEQLDKGADNPKLTAALADAGHLYSTLDRLRKDLDPSLWRSVLSLFGTPLTSWTQQQQDFARAMTDTFRVVEAFLNLFQALLQSEAGAQAWEQARALFLRDLNRVVEMVKL
jgi:hypothetical protein